MKSSKWDVAGGLCHSNWGHRQHLQRVQHQPQQSRTFTNLLKEVKRTKCAMDELSDTCKQKTTVHNHFEFSVARFDFFWTNKSLSLPIKIIVMFLLLIPPTQTWPTI
ncbi:hypothetical protein GPALN_002247 [Globodera pallida]|nr:hypothetical protein GPALN_002247 [Globodera pallida]